MTKIAESLGAVYIYIYIVRFNKINLCEHRIKTMLFRQPKMSNRHSFFCACSRWENRASRRGMSIGDSS